MEETVKIVTITKNGWLNSQPRIARPVRLHAITDAGYVVRAADVHRDDAWTRV